MDDIELIRAGRHEVAEDRRIAALARQNHVKAVLSQRADVTEALADRLAELTGEAE